MLIYYFTAIFSDGEGWEGTNRSPEYERAFQLEFGREAVEPPCVDRGG